ncbi:MAG: phycobiliprotein lyase [Nostocaceae cyanobacterium]|nr:phycobiliprotein lyase [Nostocaceae cyanobacterium]
MNIEEFFQLSAGKWFAHRTSHDLAGKPSPSSKSDIIIENLSLEHPEVVQLCQQHEIDPTLAACGAKVSWNDTTRLNQKNTGSTVLVLVPDSNNPLQGKFLRSKGDGSYRIGSDESLTLIADSEKIYTEERLWFASPNLRMRVSVVKHPDGLNVASFTSEIRMGGSPPAKASEAANSAGS